MADTIGGIRGHVRGIELELGLDSSGDIIMNFLGKRMPFIPMDPASAREIASKLNELADLSNPPAIDVSPAELAERKVIGSPIISAKLQTLIDSVNEEIGTTNRETALYWHLLHVIVKHCRKEKDGT